MKNNAHPKTLLTTIRTFFNALNGFVSGFIAIYFIKSEYQIGPGLATLSSIAVSLLTSLIMDWVHGFILDRERNKIKTDYADNPNATKKMKNMANRHLNDIDQTRLSAQVERVKSMTDYDGN